MRTLIYIFLALYSISLVSCKKEKNTNIKVEASAENKKSLKKIAVATIDSKSNTETSGTITFTEIDQKVTMIAQLDNISNSGPHAIHIHAIGDCNSEDGKSAGGHWNPTNTNHGKWNSETFHIGDIGNIQINEKGNGTISRTTDLWCINCEDDKKNIIGKAIIIHKGPDDFTSQPSGAAGPRIGCGEIITQ
ncbi:superoxide dismutase family protein [Aquimarina agarivorans]|uniref:superoxide dismutase family protein n=1 Tax=Aquimarina agarivorans TaxID=980584 RepID=UPI000248E8C3|nr:superoxide dismutase family protein [Aquimarina agarivorans]